MGRINFALIRSKNPDIDAAENIQDIDSLCLSNCDIDEIENLELFHHVKELDLSGNRLARLSELVLLSNLQILDVSNNLLTAEGLRSSISQLPKSLLSVNLSGNPCAQELEAIGELQDAFPDLLIAIEEDSSRNETAVDPSVGEEYSEENNESNDGNDDNIQRDDENEANVNDFASQAPLNADDVLKMIVDRKCRLQQLPSSLDLQSTLDKLNDEMNKALDLSNNKRRTHKHADFQPLSESIERRTADLVQRNKSSEESETFRTVLERIRKSANDRLLEIHSRHALELQINNDVEKGSST